MTRQTTGFGVDLLRRLHPRRFTLMLALLALLAQSFVGLGQAQARLQDQSATDQTSSSSSAAVDEKAVATLLAESTPLSSYIVVCTPDGLKKISLEDYNTATDGTSLAGLQDCPACIPAVQAGLAILVALPQLTGFPKQAAAPPSDREHQLTTPALRRSLHSRAPPLTLT